MKFLYKVEVYANKYIVTYYFLYSYCFMFAFCRKGTKSNDAVCDKFLIWFE